MPPRFDTIRDLAIAPHDASLFDMGRTRADPMTRITYQTTWEAPR